MENPISNEQARRQVQGLVWAVHKSKPSKLRTRMLHIDPILGCAKNNIQIINGHN